jgi:pimeloyl-ACP methyl ester carboxylesterase
MARDKEITRRRIRLLDALQGRRLEEVYLLSPEFRADLELEVERGKEHFDDALLTPETLSHVKASIERRLAADKVSLTLGAPPSAAVPISARTAVMVPDLGDQDVVVIVPGAAASSLFDSGPARRRIWMNFVALAFGAIRDLELAPYDGSEHDNTPGVLIAANGAIQGLYDTLESDLSSSNFATQVFPYDWRKDVDFESVAERLKNLLLELGRRRRVHLIAHSLGGLVARRALQSLCNQIGETETLRILGQMILLGPSIKGTFAAALGLAGALRELPVFNMFPAPGPHVQPTLKTFTALYQLLPWDDTLFPSLKKHDVRKLSFWRGMIEEARLERALPSGGTPWAAGVDTQFFKDRTSVILGYHANCSTAGGVHFKGGKLKVLHTFDMNGDGFMPHASSVLEDTKAYLACGVDHIRLPMAPSVIQAIINLLTAQASVGLPDYDPTEVPCSESLIEAVREAGPDR